MSDAWKQSPVRGVVLVDESGASLAEGASIPVQLSGSSAVVEAVSVTTTAQSLNGLLSSVKAGRVAIELQNLGAGTVYVGASGVTTSTGRKVAVDEAWSPPLDADSDLHVVGDAAATLIVTQI